MFKLMFQMLSVLVGRDGVQQRRTDCGRFMSEGALSPLLAYELYNPAPDRRTQRELEEIYGALEEAGENEDDDEVSVCMWCFLKAIKWAYQTACKLRIIA